MNKLIHGKKKIKPVQLLDQDFRFKRSMSPPSARWKWLQGKAKDIDDAMDAIEKGNPTWKGVFAKED
ncbi:MAG TPA: hypothetical protein VIU12_05390 [Chryseolinea sp.]